MKRFDRMLHGEEGISAKILVAGIATFLAQFYELYDHGKKAAKINQKCFDLWNIASGSSDQVNLNEDEISEIIPDLDQDQSHFASIAQTASLAVTSAILYMKDPRHDILARIWEYFDEAHEQAADSSDEEQNYSDRLKLLRGLPVEEMKLKIDELNRAPRKSGYAKRVTKMFRSFEEGLLNFFEKSEDNGPKFSDVKRFCETFKIPLF